MSEQSDTNGIDAAFEQFREFNEQLLSAARQAGSFAIETSEKAVNRALDLELKLAGMSRQEWLKGLIETQADFARELTESYATTARGLLR
jgi:hypothetical protein